MFEMQKQIIGNFLPEKPKLNDNFKLSGILLREVYIIKCVGSKNPGVAMKRTFWEICFAPVESLTATEGTYVVFEYLLNFGTFFVPMFMFMFQSSIL